VVASSIDLGSRVRAPLDGGAEGGVLGVWTTYAWVKFDGEEMPMTYRLADLEEIPAKTSR
jgi:hypothetical protein